MQVIITISQMRAYVFAHKRKGKTIGFVPTMGYLHEGHLSLMRQSKKDCDKSIISIFVNPTQFGPREDFKEYPRDIKRDKRLAESTGVDAIFYPTVNEMYPKDYCVYVNVDKISDILCGKSRPGHFRGVTTIVAKLFNIIQPDIAYFGQKDAQQAVIIKKMVKDLDMPIRVKVMPIVREPDGLALSSRNKYLNLQERKDAIALFQSLRIAKKLVASGEKSSQKIISRMRHAILSKKSAKIDYISCIDADNLEPVSRIKAKVLIAAAVWIGRTRLIDNVLINKK